MAEIDVNRGVVSRVHREFGVRIYMYYDKPGYYYDEHERPVSEEMAGQAGFPVEQHAKERFRSEKLNEFNSKLIQQLADAEDAQDREVLKEKGEFRVLSYGVGTAIVVDKDGEKVNKIPLPKEQAFGLLDALVPTEVAVKGKGKEKAAA